MNSLYTDAITIVGVLYIRVILQAINDIIFILSSNSSKVYTSKQLWSISFTVHNVSYFNNVLLGEDWTLFFNHIYDSNLLVVLYLFTVWYLLKLVLGALHSPGLQDMKFSLWDIHGLYSFIMMFVYRAYTISLVLFSPIVQEINYFYKNDEILGAPLVIWIDYFVDIFIKYTSPLLYLYAVYLIYIYAKALMNKTAPQHFEVPLTVNIILMYLFSLNAYREAIAYCPVFVQVTYMVFFMVTMAFIPSK